MNPRPVSCEHAAQLASLDLDGEVSRFEQAMLDHHLKRCPQCATDANATAALTALLRSQPLERIRSPVIVPRRRSRAWIVRGVAVGAVVVASTWVSLSAIDRRPAAQPWAQHVPRVVIDGRYDWPAAGPPRTEQIVQFVPGGMRAYEP